MARLNIKNAPLLSNIIGTEKIPTGTRGDYTITPDLLATYFTAKLPFATKQELSQLKTNLENKITTVETNLSQSIALLSQRVSNIETEMVGFTQDLTLHKADQSNPHNVTKQQVGLGSVDNTSDINKPLSNANKAYVDALSNSLKLGLPTTYSESISNLFGGYSLGSTLLLNDGVTEVVSVVSNNTANPNSDMTGWILKPFKVSASDVIDDSGSSQQEINNLFKSGRLIDTRIYGLTTGSSLDQTSAIHLAFSLNPNANHFYIPRGIIKANIIFPRAYMYIVGDGLLNTIIEPFDISKPVVNFNKKLYSGLQDLSIQAGQDFDGESLLNAQEVRYMDLLNVDLRKTIKTGEAHKYETILIDNRAVAGSWTGYNKLRGVRGVYGAYGYLSDIDKLNSVLSMKDCLFSFNGYFNIKTACSNATFINMDVANGGKLQPTAVYDEQTYGGMYVKGDNSIIMAAWHEINAQAYPSYDSNNLYIHPESYNIAHNFARDTRGTNNVRIYTRSQGQLIDVNTADRSINDGQGRSRSNQIVTNGNFNHWDSNNRPQGYGLYFNGAWTKETIDLPIGYNTGVKIISNVAGVCGFYQHIYNPADLTNSYIKDISKWIGREITCSFWVKNIGTSTTAIRGGISRDAVNVYFSSGNYVTTTKVGEWTKIVAGIKVDGTEPRIAFGCRVSGIGEGFIFTGLSVADDCRVDDYQSKQIDESGGVIYGNLDILGNLKFAGREVLTTPFSQTTAALSSVSNSANTTNKYMGKQVFNTTDLKMYYSVSSADVGSWKSFDGATTITPS